MTAFNPKRGLIIVNARICGPLGEVVARLALDTGASTTVVRNALLVVIGYSLDSLPKTVNFTTGSGVEAAAIVTVEKLQALGLERSDFSVIAHTIPPNAGIDGLLGLDFLRNHILTLDFQNGEITLIQVPTRKS